MNDDEAWRYLTTRMLTRAGYDVVEATSGAEAARLMWSAPAVLVLDVRLPDIGGLTLCRMFKQSPDLRHIPLILVSAWNTTEEMRARWAEAGPDYIYAGPLDAQKLVEIVRSYVPSARDARPH